MTTRIVLAYDGGFNATVAAAWLVRRSDVELVTVSVDIGQGVSLRDIRERALALGAVRAHVVDRRTDAASGLFAFLQAHLDDARWYQGLPDVGLALVARMVAEVAAIERADAAAHASFSMEDDLVFRHEIAQRSLVAVARECAADIGDMAAYARALNLPLPRSLETGLRPRQGLWGRCVSATAHAGNTLGVDTADSTRADHLPPAAARVEVGFEHDTPVSLNGVPMPPAELIESLATIAGRHGVGRIMEQPGSAGEPRRVYELPAATALRMAYAAHRNSPAPIALELLRGAVQLVSVHNHNSHMVNLA